VKTILLAAVVSQSETTVQKSIPPRNGHEITHRAHQTNNGFYSPIAVPEFNSSKKKLINALQIPDMRISSSYSADKLSIQLLRSVHSATNTNKI